MGSGECSAEPRRDERTGGDSPADRDRQPDATANPGLARQRRRRALVAPSATR